MGQRIDFLRHLLVSTCLSFQTTPKRVFSEINCDMLYLQMLDLSYHNLIIAALIVNGLGIAEQFHCTSHLEFNLEMNLIDIGY